MCDFCHALAPSSEPADCLLISASLVQWSWSSWLWTEFMFPFAYVQECLQNPAVA